MTHLALSLLLLCRFVNGSDRYNHGQVKYSCMVLEVTREESGVLTGSSFFQVKALALTHWKLIHSWEGEITRRAQVSFQELLSASGA